MSKKKVWTLLSLLLVVANYSDFFINYANDPRLILNYFATSIACLALGLWTGDK